jgi:hypothetical protein
MKRHQANYKYVSSDKSYCMPGTFFISLPYTRTRLVHCPRICFGGCRNIFFWFMKTLFYLGFFFVTDSKVLIAKVITSYLDILPKGSCRYKLNQEIFVPLWNPMFITMFRNPAIGPCREPVECSPHLHTLSWAVEFCPHLHALSRASWILSTSSHPILGHLNSVHIFTPCLGPVEYCPHLHTLSWAIWILSTSSHPILGHLNTVHIFTPYRGPFEFCPHLHTLYL